MKLRTALLLTLSALLFGVPVEAGSGTDVEKLNIGTYWYGAEVDKKDLLGKVVVFEVWGKN